jgi:ABC-type spermidine/putrescine transport system permease subunit I
MTTDRHLADARGRGDGPAPIGRHPELVPAFLLAPALLAYLLLMAVPLANVLHESFKLYIPGRVGSASDAPYTLANYLDFGSPSYATFFWTTLRLSFITAFLCIALAFPIAYKIVRAKSAAVRKVLLAIMIVMVFLSALVRTYSMQLTFGAAGIFQPILSSVGVLPNSRNYIEATVVAGLVHFVLPIAALTLVGTIKNINPRLVEAAQALGASRPWAHLSITLPLSTPGLTSAFLIAFSAGTSAFVVPLILGKGRVLFISNLVYSRFSEIGNFPSGAALSIVMLLVTFLLVFLTVQTSMRFVRAD